MLVKIIRDVQEKEGVWEFDGYECEVERKHLKTGDYTACGLENILAIERKRTTGEFATNIGKKKKQFLAELDRMKAFKHAYLVLEFSVEDVLSFPVNSGVPQKYWAGLRISPKYMLSFIESLEEKYGVKVIFAGSQENAESEAFSIVYRLLSESGTN